jgi:hypothetical protein
MAKIDAKPFTHLTFTAREIHDLKVIANIPDGVMREALKQSSIQCVEGSGGGIDWPDVQTWNVWGLLARLRGL